MARSGSSSKRKSSKKKISKISSEARRKKRSRRNKSKKFRHHDDSISSYSDDESTSSLSVSSSSSDDYKSRRTRSRARGDVKDSRKRARRSNSSGESSKDSPRLRKRKGSKRKVDSEAWKKRQKKKKPRRDANVISASSNSRSCSSCRGGSSSNGEEKEFERLRGRSREKKKDKRDSSKGGSGNRKSRNRSRRSSSCSKTSDCDGNNSIEKLEVENNSRRLRSVITVANPEREGYEVNKDELTEEIVYDNDDYPSGRSNDSNDGGNKRRRGEDVMGEVASASDIITAKPSSSGKNGSDEYDGLNIGSDGARNNISPKEKESDASATSGSDDLESILRQKALENLSKFRGGLKATVPVDEKNKSDNVVKQLSTAKAMVVQSKPSKPDGSDLRGVSSQSVVPRSRFTWRRDSSVATGTEIKIPHRKYDGTKSGTAKHAVVCLPDEASKLQTFPPANSLLTNSAVNKSEDETSKTVVEISNNNDGVGIRDASGPTDLETPSRVSAEEHSPKVQQNETKDSSGFEQKTMSVMRGGERVQVSYKVYIPKKAPALARRKLNR